MMSNSPTYLLRLSSGHAKAVLDAVELYQRLAMGDFHEIGRVFEGKNGDWQEQREQGLDELLDRLKNVLAPDLSPRGHNYGYASEKTGETGRLLYEVLSELRYRIAWTERPPQPGRICDRNHYEPILFPSSVKPKPQCASEDGRQPELAATGERLAREIEAELGTTDIKEALAIIRRLKNVHETYCNGQNV